MRLPKFETLLKTTLAMGVCSIGGISYIGLGHLSKIGESDYVKEAFKLVRSHRGECKFVALMRDVLFCIDSIILQMVHRHGAADG